MKKQPLAIFMLCAASFQSLASLTLPENEHDCFVVPDGIANVGSPVRGVVSQMLVDRGDRVVKGQPIAVLESGTERILLSLAMARAEMDSEVAARKSDLELSQLEFERIEDLHRQGLAPTQQRDEAKVAMQIARAGFEQALENKKLILIELERARHDLAQRTVKSPSNGVVVEQFVVPGEFLYDEPVMSIATLDPLRVEVVLPAEMFGSIQNQDQALITTELNPDHPLEARVDIVDALLDTRSGTFGVRLKLPNKENAITAGQKCTIDFDMASRTLEIAEESD